jgi:hypothetical protein
VRPETRAGLIVALVAVMLLTAYFVVRLVLDSQRLVEGEDGPIREWMTISLIAHNYDVPPELINEAIGLPPEAQDPRPIGVIAEEQGRDPDELIRAIAEAIDAARPGEPPPPAPPQDAGREVPSP